MQKVSASIVLYNTPTNQLKRVLNCIFKSNVVDRIFLIDNSPISKDLILYHHPKVTYIKAEKNLGYGAGHNIALKHALANSAFHFVINPDIYFESGELLKMIDRIEKDNSIGQIMPRVIYPDKRLQYLCKLIPTPFDLLYRRFLPSLFSDFTRKKAEQFELRFTGYSSEMDVPYLSGCFMLFRTSALKKVGLFDERFFMYPEDIDISRRMHAQFRTLFFPGATIVHAHSKESYSSKKMLWIHLTNLIKYFNKWGWFFDAERKEVNLRTLNLLREKHGFD